MIMRRQSTRLLLSVVTIVAMVAVIVDVIRPADPAYAVEAALVGAAVIWSVIRPRV